MNPSFFAKSTHTLMKEVILMCTIMTIITILISIGIIAAAVVLVGSIGFWGVGVLALLGIIALCEKIFGKKDGDK